MSFDNTELKLSDAGNAELVATWESVIRHTTLHLSEHWPTFAKMTPERIPDLERILQRPFIPSSMNDVIELLENLEENEPAVKVIRLRYVQRSKPAWIAEQTRHHLQCLADRKDPDLPLFRAAGRLLEQTSYENTTEARAQLAIGMLELGPHLNQFLNLPEKPCDDEAVQTAKHLGHVGLKADVDLARWIDRLSVNVEGEAQEHLEVCRDHILQTSQERQEAHLRGEHPAALWGLWYNFEAPATDPLRAVNDYLARIAWHTRAHSEIRALERYSQTRSAPRVWDQIHPLPADTTAVHTYTTLSGGGSTLTTPTSFVLKWGDGQQLTLPLNEGDGPLLAIGRRYGPAAVACLWAAIGMHWASGANASEGFHWWPEEHLWWMGSTSSDAHHRLRQTLESLEAVQLTATYPGGRLEEGPILASSYRTRNKRRAVQSARMSIHPALTYPACKGGHWYPSDRRLIAIINRKSAGQYAGSLAIVAAQQLSLTSGRDQNQACFRKDVQKLIDQVGLRRRQDDRRHDSRALETLEHGAQQLVEGGFFERYAITDGVFEAWPARSKGPKPRRPPLLPATGDELKAWEQRELARLSLTRTALARSIGVSARTMKRGVDLGSLRLTPDLRAALRRYLWRVDR